MEIGSDSETLKSGPVCIGADLTVVVCNHDTAYGEAPIFKFGFEPEHVGVVGYAKILTHLVLFYVDRAYDNYDFGTVAELLKHLELAVRLEAGKYPACVIVVKQFSAQFQIKFVSELPDAFLDMFGLDPYILFVVKTVFHIVR